MGANDAAEQLAAAIEEVGKLERGNADLSRRLVWNLKRADTAQAECDAALAVIEQVRALSKRARPSAVSGNLIADGNALARIVAASSPDALDAVKREAAAVTLEEAARGFWGIDGDPDYASTSGAVRRCLNKRAEMIRNPRTPGEETSGQVSP